jgi:hypothetical protein
VVIGFDATARAAHATDQRALPMRVVAGRELRFLQAALVDAVSR